MPRRSLLPLLASLLLAASPAGAADPAAPAPGPGGASDRPMLHGELTLSLRVTGVRADGYHLIDAEMVSVSLHDVLTVDPDGDGLGATGTYADGVPLDGSNLVGRALRSQTT